MPKLPQINANRLGAGRLSGAAATLRKISQGSFGIIRPAEQAFHFAEDLIEFGHAKELLHAWSKIDKFHVTASPLRGRPHAEDRSKPDAVNVSYLGQIQYNARRNRNSLAPRLRNHAAANLILKRFGRFPRDPAPTVDNRLLRSFIQVELQPGSKKSSSFQLISSEKMV